MNAPEVPAVPAVLAVLDAKKLDGDAYKTARAFFGSVARRIVRDASLRDDVIAEASIKLHRALERGAVRLDARTEKAARAYLETLLERTAIDLYRKRKDTAVEDVETLAPSAPSASDDDASALSEDTLRCVRALDRAVVEQQPALAETCAQIVALQKGEARSLGDFVEASLDPAERKRARNRLQQHHSRWRSLLVEHARAALAQGEIDADLLRSVERFVCSVRQRAPMKPRGSVSASATR